MARVVQRRGTPPYLLILFVCLFLLSATLAVIFYVQSDDKTKLVTDANSQLANVKKELAQARDEKLPNLIKAITGRSAGDTGGALLEADLAYKLGNTAEYGNLGLVAAVKGLDTTINEQKELLTQRDARITALGKVITERDQAIDAVKKQLESETTKLTQQINTIQGQVAAQIKAKDDQLARAVAEQQALLQQKEQRIGVLAGQISNKDLEVQQRDAEIAKLRGMLREYRDPVKVGDYALIQADGKVAKALLEQDIIYVNLGEQDGAVVGLPFAVYSAQTGVTKDGQGKGKITVINVGPTTSECRVTESKREDPIVEGDVVANLVFDTTRKHYFVVEGDFDLYGDGVADPLGNQRVRKLIEGFGGQIVDNVGINTDFVVMGEEPGRPKEPSEDAPAADWTRFNDRMKKYQHYVEVQAAAQTLQIPILNTTRFLAFSGFVPKKRLAD